MPLDPSIVLGATRPLAPPENPLDTVLKFQQLQTQRENLASLAAERQANTALAQQRIAENQRVLQGRSTYMQALQAGRTTDPTTGQTTLDDNAVSSFLIDHGFPELGESHLKTAATVAEAIGKLQDQHRAHAQAVADEIGSIAQRVNSDADLTTALGNLAARGAITTQDALTYRRDADQRGWEAVKNDALAQTTSAKKAREKLSEPIKLGPGEQLVIPGVAGSDQQVVATGGPKQKPVEEQSLDAYAVSLGKKTAADLTDAELQKYALRKAQVASGVAVGQHAAERQYDIAHPLPEKVESQDKLEQQYRTILGRAMSSRSGGIGLEDNKVRQANHLLALFDQNYDPKTGNYNLSQTQVAEAALGLATLIAPGGQPGVEMMREINQRTAKGDVAGLLTYLTGSPVTGTTQKILRMYKDSIQRQGEVAEQNREASMAYLRGLAPTDLDEARREKLESTNLVPLRRPSGTTPSKPAATNPFR